uniref:Uncharacterized protein n=1 Tax=Electrophorus electricus TaxID=8005 RepID=A0A4W4FNJ9_ELEEL
MNKTLLLSLLTRCREAILKELEDNRQTPHGNLTTVAPTQTTGTSWARHSYDNAYFYILFVMFVYSFLALALFRSFIEHDKTKKDPYEEFMDPDHASAHKYGEGSAQEKLDM